jgi:transposase
VHVVYESGPNGYNLHDCLEELNGEDGRQIHVYIAPPAMIPEAPGKKKVKTDRRDAVKLIQAFESDSFRPVVVPDAEQRACRQLVRERERIKKDASRIKNRIHGLIKFHGLDYTETKLWSAQWREALIKQAKEKDDTGHIQFVLKTQFKMLESALKLQAATEKRLCKFMSEGKKKELMRTLTRQTGIGPVTAAVIATEVADFRAFDNSDAFASYTGLVSGARGTGKVMHLGPITKVGNRRLRWAFVESAWTWVRYDKEAKQRFELLKARRGARRAIVAMARRLAVVVYHQVVHVAQPEPQGFHD